MKRVISGMLTAAMLAAVVPAAAADHVGEVIYSWTFDDTGSVTTEADAYDIPVVNDTAQVGSGYVSLYSGHGASITLSDPVTIGENDIVTVEADIAYAKESKEYTVFSVSSSEGTNDLVYSNLCRYTDTSENSLKLGGTEKLTLNDDGTYKRPSFPATSGNNADTDDGWVHYTAVFDYNVQLMTLTLSSSEGTTEYSSPLSYETDIAEIKLASSHQIGRACYADNVTITKAQSDIPYVPGEKVMSITAEADGDSTVIDTSSLYRDSHVSRFAVYTADDKGNKLSESIVDADSEIVVDTSDAAVAEVVPVFKYSDIGSAVSEKILRTDVENGLYNFVFKKAGTKRSDIYVNGAMVANNADKDGYNRRISEGSEIIVHDIKIEDGSIRIKTDDTSEGTLSWCEFYRAPSIAERVPKVYIIGDSLVANYYGTYTDMQKAQFGWGQVIDSFFTDDVETVNLANGGHYATILETTAFPGVLSNACEGDYLIIESGYNDMKHNSADVTRGSVERIVNAAKERGIVPVVVSPNASMQQDDTADDYVESVRYTDAMKTAAENTGAIYIDLSGESYRFFREHYGDDRTAAADTYYFPGEPDLLHHNYLGAMNCARIVAQGLYDSGAEFINTEYDYTYTDALDNEISLKVDTGAHEKPTEPVETEQPDMRKCIKIIAEYEPDGTLKDLSTESISVTDIVPEENTADRKVFYWKSFESMEPVLFDTGATEAPQESSQPTAAPPGEEETVPPVENEAEVIDLSGAWELSLSDYEGADFGDTVTLPGTLSENEKGTKNDSTDKTKLSLKYKYTGSATYRKRIDIPSDWDGKSVTLSMERTKLTKVWVNGVEETNCNTSDSIAVPHEYRLENLVPGQENTITVQVTNGTGPSETKSDNVYGLFRTKTHMLTAETQTDWNGIIGDIVLKAADNVYIKDVMVYPSAEKKQAVVKAVVQNDTGDDVNGTIALSAQSYNHDGSADIVPKAVYSSSFAAGESTLEYTYDMGDDIRLWSEFHPSLYRMTVSLDAENGAKNDYVESFGMRDWGTSEGQFTINGNKTFLRGEANSAVFPETGYPYMTKEEWTAFFKKAQSIGINFFRFHSWIPPMSAFEAADELGIYMQPEMYGFGGTPTENDFNNTLYGEDGINALKYFASNPSFVMMAFGNEMTTTGSSAEAVEAYRAKLKAIDPTRLYAEGTNNNLSISKLNENDDFWTTAKVGMDGSDQQIRLSFAWNNDANGGRLEGEQPNSCQDYSAAVEYLGSDIPVMGHEVGQYQVLPKFDEEIAKYDDTVFAPRNLSNFRQLMQNKGMLEMNDRFSESTARTSAIQYRADIEAALKTNNFGGYQLLSIQDFPGQNTALVGILDSFMDDKDGGFTAEEYRSFNGPVTTIARIPKYVYNTDEDFTAEIVTTNYSESVISNVSAEWKITDEDGAVIADGETNAAELPQGAVTTVGKVDLGSPFAAADKARKLTFTVSAAGSENSYSLWVYPKEIEKASDDVLIADAYTKEVRDTLAAGGKVLMLPTPTSSNLINSVSVRWTNDYWSSMFHGRVNDAATTMGIYLDPESPVFRDFPTESFGDYQWYNLMKNSRAVVLDDAPDELEPLVWNIDHMAYSRKLSSLFEVKVGDGKLLVCTMDILNQMESHPEVRQMYNSLVEYVSSDAFEPKVEVTTDYLRTIFKQVITSEGDVSAYEEISGFDYSWSQTKGELKSQSGTDEEGNGVTNAVGGISAGDMLRFDNIKFSGNGSETIRISAANGSSSGDAAIIEVYAGGENGYKLGVLEFKNTGGWDKFNTQEFELPHLWGTENILFKFTNANICLDNIIFVESMKTYRDPYILIDPSNTSAGAVDIIDIGGSHSVEQLTVKIDGAVRVTIPNCDFGFIGSSALLIGGSVLSESGEAELELIYTGDGEEKRIPVTFKNNEGESYALESGTTGGLTFWRNEIKLPDEIKGVQDIALEFKDGTSIQLADITFVDESTETKFWDFSEYTTEVKAVEEGFVEEYDGLKIAIAGNGADNDHDSVSAEGVYWRGGASSGESTRYIEYTPKVNGRLEVTGRIARKDGRWGISTSRAVNTLKADTSSSTSTDITTCYLDCDAGTTYYIINKSRGANIYSIKFIPE